MGRRFRRRKGSFNQKKHSNTNFDVIKWEKLEYLAEDILRMLAEREKNTTSFLELESLCCNSKKLGRILDILRNKNYIKIFPDSLELTEDGQQYAQQILRKHIALENAFQQTSKTLSVHKIAHILEHSISKDEMEKMLSITQMQTEIHSYSLDNYQLPVGTIHKLTFASEKLFYKMLSLGIYPGQRIEILLRNNINQVIRVKNSRFAIDITIARNIFVFP
jgi:Mn-dependent DtxR family transcriptional regulator/Fe2+ transport system protein FeoA